MLKITRNKLLYVLTNSFKNDENFKVYVEKWMTSFYYYSILLYIFWFLVIGLLELLFFPVSYDLPQHIIIRISLMKILVLILIVTVIGNIKMEYDIVAFIENMSLNIDKKRKFIIQTFFYNSFFIWCIVCVLFLPLIIVPALFLKFNFLKDIFIILYIILTSSCIISFFRLLKRALNNTKKKSNTFLIKMMYSTIICIIPYIMNKFYYYYELIKNNKMAIIDMIYNNFGVKIESLIFHNNYTLLLCTLIILSIIAATKYMSDKVLNYQDEKNKELKIRRFNKILSVFVELYRRYGIIDEDLIVITIFLSFLNLLLNYSGKNTLAVNSIMLFILMNLTFRRYNTEFILYLRRINVSVFKITLMNSFYTFFKLIILLIPFTLMNKFTQLFLFEYFVINIPFVYITNLIYVIILKKLSFYFRGELLKKVTGYIAIITMSLIVYSIFSIIL